MGCPPVRGDNPRAIASGLSHVQVDKHGITILYHQHQCRPCTSKIFRAKVGKCGINFKHLHTCELCAIVSSNSHLTKARTTIRLSFNITALENRLS